MNKKLLLLVICMFGITGFHWWDPIAKWMGIGNQALQEGQIDTAKEAYSKVENLDQKLPELKYNQGISDILNEEPDMAVKHFEDAYRATEKPELEAKALYNKGIAEAHLQEYEEAVESFKKSLKLNPDDDDAKANLELVRKYLQMQPPTPQSQQQQNKDQQEKDDEEEEQENPQNQSEQENQLQQPEQQSTASPTPKDQASQNRMGEDQQTPTPTPEDQSQAMQTPSAPENQTPSPQPGSMVEEGKMSEQEAQRILDALEDEEMEVLKRFHQLPKPEGRIEKDW